MNHFLLDKAQKENMDAVYMMGFDVWSDGTEMDAYLQECRSSEKYKKGTWYVLKNKDELLSSLIVYKFASNTFGIGSIATPPAWRKRGYASNLISGIIADIENDNPQAIIFLYSDIEPDFYNKFGFKKLPDSLQRYKTTTCMVKSKILNDSNGIEGVPEYF